MQCWEGPTVGRQEVSPWRGEPFGKMSLWKAGKDNNHQFLSAMDPVTWSVPPAQYCRRTDVPEVYFFWQCWAICSPQCTLLSVPHFFLFLPWVCFNHCSSNYFPYFPHWQYVPRVGHCSASCCPLDRLFSGHPEQPPSLWRASPLLKGFWPNSLQSFTGVCGYVSGT